MVVVVVVLRVQQQEHHHTMGTDHLTTNKRVSQWNKKGPDIGVSFDALQQPNLRSSEPKMQGFDCFYQGLPTGAMLKSPSPLLGKKNIGL